MSAFRHASLDERHDPAIVIVDHDPAWAGRATAELARIAAAVPGAQGHHVGSTAVPGLAAKAILDLLVAVPAGTAFVAALEALGYLYAGAFGERHFFALPHDRPRTHHVHVVPQGSETEQRHIAVRDFLIANPDEARAYADVKRRAAEHARLDRIAYIEGKEEYVVALEQRAISALCDKSA